MHCIYKASRCAERHKRASSLERQSALLRLGDVFGSKTCTAAAEEETRERRSFIPTSLQLALWGELLFDVLMYRDPFIRWLRWKIALRIPLLDKNVEGLLLSFPELMCKPVAGYDRLRCIWGKKSRCHAKCEFSALVLLFLIFAKKCSQNLLLWKILPIQFRICRSISCIFADCIEESCAK